MKIITADQLHTVDPGKDCIIIKNVFTPGQCEQMLDYLHNFSNTNLDNVRYRGENWHYWVRLHDDNYDSFTFNDLDGLNAPPVKHFFEKLFSLYTGLGEDTNSNDFDIEYAAKLFVPLIFWYKASMSKLGWHKHPPEQQKFQLVCNLTRPMVDYMGGETVIYMGDGAPAEDQVENCETYDIHNFHNGDVLSFPYGLWHKVNPIKNGNGGMESRVSLLMPFAKRSGGSMNEYIDPMM